MASSPTVCFLLWSWRVADQATSHCDKMLQRCFHDSINLPPLWQTIFTHKLPRRLQSLASGPLLISLAGFNVLLHLLQRLQSHSIPTDLQILLPCPPTHSRAVVAKRASKLTRPLRISFLLCDLSRRAHHPPLLLRDCYLTGPSVSRPILKSSPEEYQPFRTKEKIYFSHDTMCLACRSAHVTASR